MSVSFTRYKKKPQPSLCSSSVCVYQQAQCRAKLGSHAAAHGTRKQQHAHQGDQVVGLRARFGAHPAAQHSVSGSADLPACRNTSAAEQSNVHQARSAAAKSLLHALHARVLCTLRAEQCLETQCTRRACGALHVSSSIERGSSEACCTRQERLCQADLAAHRSAAGQYLASRHDNG